MPEQYVCPFGYEVLRFIERPLIMSTTCPLILAGLGIEPASIRLIQLLGLLFKLLLPFLKFPQSIDTYIYIQ